MSAASGLQAAGGLQLCSAGMPVPSIALQKILCSNATAWKMCHDMWATGKSDNAHFFGHDLSIFRLDCQGCCMQTCTAQVRKADASWSCRESLLPCLQHSMPCILPPVHNCAQPLNLHKWSCLNLCHLRLCTANPVVRCTVVCFLIL